MKNNIIISFTATALCALLTACGDLESIHEQYLNGEQIYAGKLDSLYVRSGFNRLMLVGNTKYLGNSCQAVVEFDNHREVFEITDPKTPFYSIIIDNLEERTYEFKVYTLDKKDNMSIIQTVSGKSIGDIFITSQKNRRLLGYERNKDGLFASWAHKAENPYAEITRFSYQSLTGEITEYISNDSVNMKLPVNWIPQTEANIESGIITGENGIDTIFLDKTKIHMPDLPLAKLEKSLFRLMHLPSDNKGNSYGANPDLYLFDDDSRWLGDRFGYHSGENAIPLHFTIDLGVKAALSRMRIDMRDPANFAGNNPTKIELWGINDLTGSETSVSDPDEFISKGWNLISQFSIDGANSLFEEMDVPGVEKYRYIRFRVTETVKNQGFQLVELTFWANDYEEIN
ncbi:MAG: DUF4998 domain-containing protein [Bacteroidales bacterium]